MIYIKPHIKSWAERYRDVKKHLSHAQRAVNADNPLLAKSLLEQAEEVKRLNDDLFDRICQTLRKAIETKPSALPCPQCGHHTLFGEGLVSEGNEVTQHMSCPICETHWKRVYKFDHCEVKNG